MAFRRAPSADSSAVDPVDFELYAEVPSHRRARGGDGGEEGTGSRSLRILHNAHIRDLRTLFSLRSRTAIASKGRTTTNPVEAAMRERAEEAAHAAAEHHILQMKRRLAVHLYENFAKADADVSLELDWDEWKAWFGRKDTSNPLFDTGYAHVVAGHAYVAAAGGPAGAAGIAAHEISQANPRPADQRVGTDEDGRRQSRHTPTGRRWVAGRGVPDGGRGQLLWKHWDGHRVDGSG